LTAATDIGTATLRALTVTLTGSGAPDQISGVRLWLAAADGSFTSDAGHLLASAAGFSGSTATLTLASGLTVSDTATTLYVTLDFKATAAFGATYALKVADASAVSLDVDQSASAIFPLTWDPVTLSRAPKLVPITGSGIQPSEIMPGLVNVPVLAFHPSVLSGDTTLTAVTVALTGSPLSDLTRVKLWRDSGDGVFSPASDTLLQSVVPSGAQTTLSPATAQTIAATDDAWFYVTFDVSSAAEPDRTHGASLTALDFTLGDQAAGLPIASGDFTVRALSAGLLAADNLTYTITPSMDRDPARPGVQTVLYGGGAAGQVSVRVTNDGTLVYENQTAAAGDGSWSLQPDWLPGANLVQVAYGVTTLHFEVDLVDPSGVVYDAVTGLPVAGATVSIYQESDPVTPLATETTDAHGQYSFLVPAGSYRLTVAVPGYGAVPPGSQLVVVPAGNGLGTAPGSQDGPYTDIYYGDAFTVAAVPLHFDIPLDPTGFALLALTKTADRPSATVGDLVTFRLKLVNASDTAWADLNLTDVLPSEFRYLVHSTQVDGRPVSDPAVNGRTLTFPGLTVPARGELSLTYRVVVSPSAAPGNYVNTAQVQRTGSAARLSNVASATVRVVKDQLFQTATLLGRVFQDDDGDGFPGAVEGGLAGVRVVVDDGTVLTTDANGRFHLSGLTSASRALKVDPASLPGGATLTTPNPVMVTLRPGLPSDVSFGVKVPAQPAAAPVAGTGEFHLLAGEVRLTNAGSEGRLAGYLRREVLGGLKLVASLDTSRAKTAQPGGTEGQGYATFGDQSAADLSATKSSSPLYLSLTGQTFQATLGDFQVPAPQGAGREATGAQVEVHSPAGPDGKAERSLDLYAGALAYPKVRDELRAQDGSLYYLSHRPAVSGTERLWVEVRDEATTRVVARIDLSRGKDYELDYPGGRVITRTPLPSTVRNGSLLGQPVESDYPVYLVADYQYDSGADFSPQVYGGRGEAAVGQSARASVAVDVSDNGQMVSGELSGKAGSAVEYRLQAGSGHTTAVARYTSNDGGVTYQAAPEPTGTGTMFAAEAKVAVGVLAAQAEAEAAEKGAGQKAGAGKPGDVKLAPAGPAALLLAGKPSKTQSQVAQDLAGYWDESLFSLTLADEATSGATDLTLFKTSPVAEEILAKKTAPLVLPGWWKEPEGLVLAGKLKETTAGFTAGVDPAATDQTQVNLELLAKPGTGASVSVGSDANYTDDRSDKKVTAAVKIEERGASLTAQFGQLTTAQGGTETLARTLSAKYEYPLSPTTTVSLGRKINYDQEDLNVTFLGGSAILGRAKVEAEYDTGETQKTGKVGLTYELPAGGRIYGNWEGGEQSGTTLNQFTFGGSAGVSAKTRVFLERKLNAGADGVAASETAGAEWRPTDKLGYSFSLSHGLAPGGAERSSEALAFDYREEGRLGSAAVEVANQTDGRRDVSLKGKAELALTAETTLVGRALLTQTSGAGFTGGNVSELGVGTAYRPVKGDRLNLLSQVTLRTENGDASGTGSDSGTVTSLVLSSEGLYRLNRSWRLGGKAAWKR
ncbi:MAG: carboxypeptidase regulatory-like domain-containing protein, partial [Methanocella sp.]